IILPRPSGFPADVDLHKCNSLAGEQRLGGMAIAAIAGGIDFDLCHRAIVNSVLFRRLIHPALYMGARVPATTRAKASTLTSAAPARNSARAQASTVAPVVITSSTRISRRPVTAALPAALTWNAPCTLSARADWERPTCCGVAFKRLSAPNTSRTPEALRIVSASN